MEIKMHVGCFVQIDGRAGLGRKFTAARKMVRLNVGLNDMRDPHMCALARLKILVNLLLWIHHSATALSPSPKEVRGTAGLWLEKLSEDHLHSLPSHTPTANFKTSPFEKIVHRYI